MEDKRDQTQHARSSAAEPGRVRISRRRLLGFGAGSLTTALLAACGGAAPPAPSAPPQPTTAPAAPVAATKPAAPAAPAAKAAVKAFHGAWPYQVPPEGHFNSLAGVQKSILGGGSGAGSIYRDILEMPLGMFFWQEKKWMPLLATEWRFDGDNFRVKLREGAKWSDGKTFTSKDVVTTFWCNRIMRQPAWNYIDDVKADGEYGVVFHMSSPSTVVERYIIRDNIKSDATFGDWAKKVQDLYAAGKNVDSEEGKKLNTDIQQFRPKEMVTTGPFKIDPNSITNAQLTLVKNASSWAAEKVAFDRVVLFNGETPDITPVVLAKDVDYATHGFPPATEQAFKQAGIRVARPPIYNGGALYFNFDKVSSFFGDKRVRQAVAMAIDRAQNATVTYGESAKPVKYMAGMADSLVDQWLSKDDVAKLATYTYDPKKAEEILTGLNWKKGGDGVWLNDKGERAEFELLVAAEFVDNAASAQNAAEQLTKFGIKTALRTVTFTQVDPDVWKGNFQIGYRGWGSAAHPHPQFSYDTAFFQWNTRAANQGGRGIAFDLKQKTDSVGEVDLQKLTVDSALGLDESKQRENLTKIARAYNELLHAIPLYERFGNNPVLENVRVTGWPKDDDIILKNSAYADSFVIMMLLEGRLKPI